jgi:hypothetical protein
MRLKSDKMADYVARFEREDLYDLVFVDAMPNAGCFTAPQGAKHRRLILKPSASRRSGTSLGLR